MLSQIPAPPESPPHSQSLFGEVRLRQIRVTGKNVGLDMRQTVESLLAQTEMVLDDLLGRETQPLCDGDVVVNGSLEDLCLSVSQRDMLMWI